MKKIVSLLLTLSILSLSDLVFAVEMQSAENISVPKWEDYVPKKYQNPTRYERGSAIAELSVGGVLTDLIITCPIGIPMICHATTKLKNISYYDKKIKFNNGLAEAEKIKNISERQAYYEKLLKTCDMTQEDKEKLAKKRAKKLK